jgi:hypothetical protein
MISLAVTALFLATVTPTYAAAPYEPNEPGTVGSSGTSGTSRISGTSGPTGSSGTLSDPNDFLPAAGAQPATYHDVAAMDVLDGAAGGRMQVHDIGTTANGRPVRAVHIAATPNLYGTEAEASMADKPALLIECGMHARE